MEKIRVNYKMTGYKVERNVLNKNLEHVEFKRKYDLFKFPQHLFYKIIGDNNTFLANSHYPINFDTNNLWHLFDGVSFGKRPWVSTFVSYLPRWSFNKKSIQRKGVQLIAGFNCKKLIGISNCSLNIQKAYIDDIAPQLSESIKKKMAVLHPPQESVITEFNEKRLNKNNVVFTIVGAAFFLKGGAEILRVFDHLLEKNRPVKLQIVSSLEYGDFASKATKDDFKEAQRIITKHENIIHYKSLPNKKVLDLFKNNHVGLLPSYADTYGYSVLEAQAAGCPVITTDIRALPEINSREYGWMIKLPKYESGHYNELGRARYRTKEGREKISTAIEEQLETIIEEILNDPETIKLKGKKSLARINREHDPKKHANRLYEIYQKALE